jgi:FkbM family methyltransferase
MSLIARLQYRFHWAVMMLRDLVMEPIYPVDGGTVRLPKGGNPYLRKVLLADRYERDERDMIKAFLPPDMPAIELGGSYGIVSFTIRRCLHPDQKLVVVEANPQIVPVCRDNATRAGAADQTVVVHAALAYGGTRARFRVNWNVHVSQLVFDGSTGPDIVDVPSVTLAGLRQTHGIDGPYSLVCDIEGAELLVLRNEAEALKQCRMLILETHPSAYDRMGGSLDEVLSTLRAMGFTIFNKRSDVIAARRD